MTLPELMAQLRREHLVAEGLWQDARIEALIECYASSKVLDSIAVLHQEQALIEASKSVEDAPVITDPAAIFPELPAAPEEAASNAAPESGSQQAEHYDTVEVVPNA